MFREQADLSTRIHYGAWYIDVELARRRGHGDADVETQVAAEGSLLGGDQGRVEQGGIRLI